MGIFLLILAITGIAIQLLILLVALFEPPLPYCIRHVPGPTLNSEEFARVLSILADAESHPNTQVDVLTNGDLFYEAELTAIAAARSHVCIEAYIFQKGEIASRFIERSGRTRPRRRRSPRGDRRPRQRQYLALHLS